MATLLAHVRPSQAAPLAYHVVHHALVLVSAPSVIQTGSDEAVMGVSGSPVYMWLVSTLRCLVVPAGTSLVASVLALAQPTVSQQAILTCELSPADSSVVDRVGTKDVTSTGLLTLISIDE